MDERKVLNKYCPPDFDPSKIPRRKQPKNKQMTVPMMLPMSTRCNTCGNCMYKGTKFNSRKEDAVGESYLGIQIVRFYFKCTKCSAELTMKTDPKNSDYTVEASASRNFEPWRNKDEELDKEKKKRDAEERGDAMKSLENRTLDSKHEMDSMAGLHEMRSLKSVRIDALLKVLQRTGEDEEEDPDLEQKVDEASSTLIKSLFYAPKEFVKRIYDDDEWDDDDDFRKEKSADDTIKRQKISGDVGAPTDILATGDSSVDTKNPDSLNGKRIIKRPTITFKAKKKQDEKQICMKKDESKQQVPENTVGSNILGSLSQYDSSEDDE